MGWYDAVKNIIGRWRAVIKGAHECGEYHQEERGVRKVPSMVWRTIHGNGQYNHVEKIQHLNLHLADGPELCSTLGLLQS